MQTTTNTSNSNTMGTLLLQDSFSSCSSEDETSLSSDSEEIHTTENSIGTEPDTDRPSKRENIIFKLLNRERNGFFSDNPKQKINRNAFRTVPSRLSFCLKEIVPFCYLKGHVFLGLTACGNFLLSYKAVCDYDLYEFPATYKYKYELYFWIYSPHNLLAKYYKVCLFDDHGVEYLEVVTLTQWISNPRTVIVHGANSSEFENEDSYLTILSVPKLGCLDCKSLRDEYYSDSLDGSRSAALCIRCNLTIHTKYSRSESDPIFDPKLNLNCPERIVIFSGGLIHMMNVQLELNKQLKQCSNSIDISYISKRDKNTLVLECNSTDDKQQTKSVTSNVDTDEGTTNGKSECKTIIQRQQSNDNRIVPEENIVARIIADFAECETDLPSQEKYQKIETTDNQHSKKHFDELMISCSSASSSSGMNTNRVRLISHRSHRIIARSIRTGKSNIKTIDLQPSSSTTVTTTTTTTTTVNKNMDRAAKAYEFSEDNEKCEKISIFRKRRLADKKYEFSEDNLENIIPFTKLRSNRLRNFPVRAKSGKSSSMSPSPQYNGNTFEMTAHTHRASPSHGFRSPCGSPVGNRFLMSPPGRTSSLYGKSPTYAKPFSSPRHISKRSYLDFFESSSNPLLSPRSDDFDMQKQFPVQPLSEVKPSNNIDVHVASSVAVSVDKVEKDGPNCSKKLVRRYVEEDDATSVITSEEDDCISPGYHTSLPVEVHGACYSSMQMISQSNYHQLKCPSVIITQHTFDLETLTYHIANHLCSKNNKKCGYFNDWAYAPVNICPLSCTLTCILIVNFTGRELKSSTSKQCANCSNSQHVDCVIHRKQYECSALFTWNIETGDWQVLDYGDLLEIAPISTFKSSGELNSVVNKMANEFSANLNNNRDIFSNLSILDSCTDKSKEFLTDLRNSIEFYRTDKRNESFADYFSNFDCESQ